MNLVLWAKESSAAIPFSTLLALLVLWFCVSVPLTFVGALFGFRKRVSILKCYCIHAYVICLLIAGFFPKIYNNKNEKIGIK